MNRFDKILVKKIWSTNPDKFKNITLSVALKRYHRYVQSVIESSIKHREFEKEFYPYTPDSGYVIFKGDEVYINDSVKCFEDWLRTEI